jgi:hypothetical protein
MVVSMTNSEESPPVSPTIPGESDQVDREERNEDGAEGTRQGGGKWDEESPTGPQDAGEDPHLSSKQTINYLGTAAGQDTPSESGDNYPPPAYDPIKDAPLCRHFVGQPDGIYTGPDEVGSGGSINDGERASPPMRQLERGEMVWVTDKKIPHLAKVLTHDAGETNVFLEWADDPNWPPFYMERHFLDTIKADRQLRQSPGRGARS